MNVFERIEGEVFVRQVLTNDSSRHFAVGSVLFCRVDIDSFALIIHTDIVSLRSAEVIRHHYSPQSFCLIVRFSDKPLEISLYLDSDEVRFTDF